MRDYREQARLMWSQGFQVIPVTREKNPALPEWGKYAYEDMKDEDIEKYFADCWGVALLMGGKYNLTAIDFDLKYDLTQTVMDRYKEAVINRKGGHEVLKKMYVQSTQNKGFHWIFSCPERIGTNAKLASRHTTAYEKNLVYQELFKSVETRDIALNTAYNDKERVLIETRGKGGYVVLNPSPGYFHEYGEKINIITGDEYDLLFESAYELNEVRRARRRDSSYEKTDYEVSPFADYNKRGDILSFLVEQGWTVTLDESWRKDVELKRPGKTYTNKSAMFDKESRRFMVFSTSTSLDPQTTYTPTDLVAEMLFDGDLSETFKYLVDNEYGIKK